MSDEITETEIDERDCADMKRLAAPMIGGVITSGILELLIYPVIYVLWRKHQLPSNASGDESSKKISS